MCLGKTMRKNYGLKLFVQIIGMFFVVKVNSIKSEIRNRWFDENYFMILCTENDKDKDICNRRNIKY